MAEKKTTKTTSAPTTLEQALEVIAQQNGVITELNETITKLEKNIANGVNKPTIEIDGKVYEVNSGARVGSEVLSPNAIAENADAAKAILEIEGQSVLTVKEA
jgi:hypothetical protein